MPSLDFEKSGGLVPAIIQDARSQQVLMLGYMNQAAWDKTLAEGVVTFFSRSKNRLWTKGESSGNYLHWREYHIDCDQDSILLLVEPQGPTCHKGAVSCFGEKQDKGFIYELQAIQGQRLAQEQGDKSSYTRSLYERGLNKMAQKVGEEAVEVVIEALGENEGLFLNESADLLFHFLLLLRAKGQSLEAVEAILRARHEKA